MTNPDGLNINAGVGSTHPEQLQALVMKLAQLLVLLLMETVTVSSLLMKNGDIVDGDKVMYIIGKHLSEKGELVKTPL